MEGGSWVWVAFPAHLASARGIQAAKENQTTLASAGCRPGEEARNKTFCSVWKGLESCGCIEEGVMNFALDLGCRLGLGRHLSRAGPWGWVGFPELGGEDVSGRGVTTKNRAMLLKAKKQKLAGCWCVCVCVREIECACIGKRDWKRGLGARPGGLHLPSCGAWMSFDVMERLRGSEQAHRDQTCVSKSGF